MGMLPPRGSGGSRKLSFRRRAVNGGYATKPLVCGAGVIMKIQVRESDPVDAMGDSLAILLPESEKLPRTLRALDAVMDGWLTRYLKTESFRGKSGEVVTFPAVGIKAKYISLIGLGKEKTIDNEALRAAASKAAKNAAKLKATRATLVLPSLRKPKGPELGQAVAEGAILGTYRFDQYREVEEPPAELKQLDLILSSKGQAAAVKRGVDVGSKIADATCWARDLSNQPGSVHTPEWLAKEARAEAKTSGLKVKVLGPKDLERESMGGILAVGRGSINPPRLIVFEYGEPAKSGRKRPTIALVGKGITFDTGGISIKPSAAMHEMKHDMSGGAAVFGAMRAIAELKLPLHVVGIVAAAENKPGADAYLPGDIVKSASGKTIEVLNTDAEGRIVLADALHYAQCFEPDAILDLATLTGACVIALGSACCAVMGNDEALATKIRAAGDRCRERVWPLPLWDEHKKAIRGDVGDIKNTGGREAGTSTAGAFLSHFVGETPWAHLDIAGTAWTNSSQPYCVKGATGFGVRLLVELLRQWK